jgi:hypothetical protein
MSVLREIEINKDDYIEVTFSGDPKKENSSYSDEYGLVKLPDYWEVQNINWERELYSALENSAIEEYLDKNYTSIEEEIIEKYQNQYD